MPLKLMYITKSPNIARIAEECGVDRIFVDLEYVGKEQRQPGDTVKNRHTADDVRAVRRAINKAELLVRVNPIGAASADFVGSRAEIDAVIDAGADIIMLPMARSAGEVREFVRLVGGRARTMLLLERRELVDEIDEVLSIDGIDEIHIGLNDLHLSYGMKFMFELLSCGVVDYLINKMKAKGIFCGFGGIARLGKGLLPSEYVICEHKRLGSGMAILSRSFCNIQTMSEEDDIRAVFADGVKNIRAFESEAEKYPPAEYEKNRRAVKEKVDMIVRLSDG